MSGFYRQSMVSSCSSSVYSTPSWSGLARPSTTLFDHRKPWMPWTSHGMTISDAPASSPTKACCAALRILPPTRAQFACLGQHAVFDFGGGAGGNRCIHPRAPLLHLAEDRHLHIIGAQLPAKDVGSGFEAFAGGGGRGVPIGDDHAAERIGGGQGHEREGIERTAPQIGVHRQALTIGIGA